jgi:hypothetical protein
MSNPMNDVKIVAVSDQRCQFGPFFKIENTNKSSVIIATVKRTFHRAGSPPSSMFNDISISPGATQDLFCNNDGLGQTITFEITGARKG